MHDAIVCTGDLAAIGARAHRAHGELPITAGSVAVRRQFRVLPDAERPRLGQPRIVIVVGVDGSEASKEALRWALEEARLRRSSVRIVLAWLPPQIAGRRYVPLELLDPELFRQAAQEQLDGFVAEVVGEGGGVEVGRVVTRGPAAKVLVEVAAEAELLVVGSRGHGGFAGLLLGSVSQQCAHHAPCPVVIVRGAAHAPEER